MGITFRQDLAAVPHPSNASTRKYGQSLVMQQQQQKYAAQQAGYDRMFQLGRDNMQNQFQMGRTKQQNEFQLGRDKTQFEQQQQLAEAERQRAFLDEARKQSSGFISDAIKNGEYDPATARKLQQNLVAEAEALGNPQLDATQRAEVLEKIRAERALLAANRMEPPPKPTRDDELKQFLGGNYDKYKDQPWVPDGKGGFTIADIPQPKDSQQSQQPKTFGEYYQMEPEKARKALADKMSEIRDSISIGEGSIAPYKSVQDKALAELEKPFEIMQDRFGQPTQAPSAATPAPTTGASVAPGGSQGSNQWADVIGSAPGGGMNIPDANARIPSLPQWRVAPGMTEDIAAQDARTQATLDSTNAQLAENQARSAEIKAGYAPRTEAVRRDANVLEGRNARAESALRGELGPRAPEADPSGPYYRNAQGKPNDNRVNSTYSISGAQADREAEQFAKNKAEFDKFKTQRAANDAKLTGRATNRIVDPEQLKRDSQKFSADYQIYKRGGGTLSTRDYIMQRAAEGTLSDDLTRQLQENYGMDLSSKGIQGVVEQDINAPREQAMSDAKAKRDAEENRKRRARGLPPIQPRTPAEPLDTTRPKRGLPGGPPTAPSQTYAEAGPTRGLPGGEPTRPTQKYANPPAPTLPKAPEPNFGALFANVKDDGDRAVLGAAQKAYANAKTPEIRDAIGVFINPDASKADKLAAFRYLQAAGIDLEQMTPQQKQKADDNAYLEAPYFQ